MKKMVLILPISLSSLRRQSPFWSSLSSSRGHPKSPSPRPRFDSILKELDPLIKWISLYSGVSFTRIPDNETPDLITGQIRGIVIRKIKSIPVFSGYQDPFYINIFSYGSTLYYFVEPICLRKKGWTNHCQSA